MINNNAYNLATGNKWILSIPYKQIDNSLTVDTVYFNLKSFIIPEISLGDTGISFRGYKAPISTNVRSEDKQISFRYKLSSDFWQYMMMYKWMKIIGIETPDASGRLRDYTLDLTVTILSEFKNPIMHVTYYGAWLKSIDRLELDYQDDNQNTLTHGFTIFYNYYGIEDVKNKQ
jgi:hypothetical protein